MGPSGMLGSPDTPIPVGYTLVQSTTRDVGRMATAMPALCRGFGTNLQWLVLFGFEDKGPDFEQTDVDAIYE